MARKTKKIKSFGKFGAGYGKNVRDRYNKIEAKQRVHQKSPFHPNARAKRIAAGIWRCMKTGKIFAGNAYHLEN